ncbi:hypothetical protein ABK040_004507 [Willaertia magna]
MTSNENVHSTLSLTSSSLDTILSTLPPLSLDPYEEYRILSYETDGKENVVPNLGAEEHFARVIQNKFDFTPTIKQRHLESIHADDSQILPPPQIKEPQEFEWNKTVNKLRATIYEVQFISEVSKLLREEKEIDTFNSYRTYNDDLKTYEKAGEIFPHRLEQLNNSFIILRNGRDQLKKRTEFYSDYYQQLFQLQKKWKLKLFKDGSNNSYVILDLAFNNVIIKSYEYIPVRVLRKKEVKEIDLIIPAVVTFGRKVILCSTILKHYSESLKTMDDVLECAQQSVFYLELFDLFVNCMMNSSNNSKKRLFYNILEYTDLEIKIKLSCNVVLVLSLTDSKISPFWELKSQLLNIPAHLSNIILPEHIDTLLQDSLLQIYEIPKEGTDLEEKYISIFEDVLRFINHKIFCGKLEQIFKEFDIEELTFSQLSFKYPDHSMYHLQLPKAISPLTITIKQTDIILQQTIFTSTKEFLNYLSTQ